MHALLTELSSWTPLELGAAVLALVYLVLAARESQWCWPAAFISTGKTL